MNAEIPLRRCVCVRRSISSLSGRSGRSAGDLLAQIVQPVKVALKQTLGISLAKITLARWRKCINESAAKALSTAWQNKSGSPSGTGAQQALLKNPGPLRRMEKPISTRTVCRTGHPGLISGARGLKPRWMSTMIFRQRCRQGIVVVITNALPD